MAFEIPLDADQVDDLNLFSTLVRAPVIGTLLWIFGSAKGQDITHELRDQYIDNDSNDDNDNDDDELYKEPISHNHQSTTSIKGECNKRQQSQYFKKATQLPSLVGSEYSDAELSESLDAVSLYGYIGSYSSNNSNSGIAKKELSWSDDVGKNLVVYEAESSIHEPKPCYEQPARPALVRSRSITADANNLMKPHMEGKYLPANPHRPNKSMMKHHSMPYPMQHQAVEPYSSGTNGYDSPQWGWYINTTPPSPEMFYSSRNIRTRNGTDSTSGTSEVSRDSTVSDVNGSNIYPNPVFQCLQDKHKTTPAGWPSVPL